MENTNSNKKVYPVNDVKYAYEAYLNKCSLNNEDIKIIFGVAISSAIKIKKPVIEEMAKNKIYIERHRVPLEMAYEIWGIDIKELEIKYSKAKKYKVGVGA